MSYEPATLKEAITAVLKLLPLSFKDIVDKPDLSTKQMLDDAMARLNNFDPNTVFSKDATLAQIKSAVDALEAKFQSGEFKDATDELNSLKTALAGDASTLAKLLAQLNNKANVGDSYAKKDEDARFAAKSDIPDITPLAKQVDLSLVEQYGLPRNYWIVKNQTSGYSMDSAGEPTVANEKAQTSDLIPLNRASQLIFMGWGGHTNDQVTVAYFGSDKKMISSIIWTQLKELTGPIMIEFWKYGPSAASYVKINANFGVGQHMMVCSEVFQSADWTPALEDLNGSSDLSNYYDKTAVDNKLAKKADVPAGQYPIHRTIGLEVLTTIQMLRLPWTVHVANLEVTQYSDTEGALDLNMVVDCESAQSAWSYSDSQFVINFDDYIDMDIAGSNFDGNDGFACLTDSGMPFSSYVSAHSTGQIKIGFRTFAAAVGANDWRTINMHLPLRKG
ncbi:hypothetical protein LROSL1_1201 [Furfurilactobacillus rossiae]|uniref:hypothetical protein n=1 Tax=Furfurilactobacillus rossiae TaxID=231049 RepID=UPI0015BB9EAC|nr:hypothetical protein [Furfurilactobacillus rossiae]QLE64018.1 hypothetical protein LROSL1_1201 [Furfurilactobacillus rossiae]